MEIKFNGGVRQSADLPDFKILVAMRWVGSQVVEAPDCKSGEKSAQVQILSLAHIFLRFLCNLFCNRGGDLMNCENCNKVKTGGHCIYCNIRTCNSCFDKLHKSAICLKITNKKEGNNKLEISCK